MGFKEGLSFEEASRNSYWLSHVDQIPGIQISSHEWRKIILLE